MVEANEETGKDEKRVREFHYGEAAEIACVDDVGADTEEGE